MKRNVILVILAGLSLLLAQVALSQNESTGPSMVELWQKSGHANPQSSSFTHWNDEGEIPVSCAACHSGEGFRAFHGIDGSSVGVIDKPVATGGVVDCATCHDDGVKQLEQILFPSGAAIAAHDGSATCLTCHQGRQSGPDLDQRTTGLPDDEVNSELSFVNPHYALAAATLFGTEVKGGYEYPGRDYAGKFSHVEAYSTCIDCHDPHSTQVTLDNCTSCHTVDALRDIRTSKLDFDGDGDVTNGIYAEISALHEKLLSAIEAYAETVSEAPIAYAKQYPYFFHAETEPTYANRYNAWTPALLRAAYNYQFIGMDKGAYAHNPHYAVQLLHDAITDLADRTNTTNIEIGPRP
ncbi:cytochrome c3 family protein [Maritalea myrionectae]|uniref:cytochrome c3 family protein n=1 Tax=Maritalea myrionectae TaxID=454601 RepID=UPI0004113CB8|nr:cytochrome c3 family protein [Maritalea myrionectae]